MSGERFFEIAVAHAKALSVLLLCGLVFVSPSAAQSFEVRALHPPQAVVSQGELRFVYELVVTNVGRESGVIGNIEISTDAGPLASIEAASMAGLVWRAPREADIDGLHLDPMEAAVFMVDVTASAAQRPDSLSHRINYRRPDIDRQRTLDWRLEIDQAETPCLGAPLDSGYWFAFNSLGNASGHRRTIVPLDGELHVSQRFAVDLVALNSRQSAYSGDESENSNWFGYGARVVAMADGTVVSVRDGLPENTPMQPPAIEIGLDTLAGNAVVLEIMEGVYIHYAHFIPGSITVEPGDLVAQGDVLGQVGNSGNSDAPHLHVHLSTARNVLHGQGVGFHLSAFALDDISADPHAFAETNEWESLPGALTGTKTCEAIPNGAVIAFGE